MGLPRDLTREKPYLDAWSILTMYRGSIVHGTYVPNKHPLSIDDKDAMVIVVPPMDHYIGLKDFGSRGTKEVTSDPWDIVVYEARKFIRLLKKGNPNVLQALWLKPKNYLKITPAGQMLIDNRDMFVAKTVYRSFTGYAYAQLKKMENFKHEGYMGEKRKRLVTQFGYDTKNASHLIRLLKMGIEFLNDGRLYPERHDAKYLIDIKQGQYTCDQIKAEAVRLFEMADDAYVRSSLPAEPNTAAINELCEAVIKEAHHLSWGVTSERIS